MGAGGPLAALADCLQRHEISGRVGVAVSGGGDSMALLVLAAEAGVATAAVSVDHGLRPEGRDEIAAVASLCARLGVEHHVLHWRHDGRGNLQAAARAGRYGLIAGWARSKGLQAVLLGHTLDDQAETVLMRLARGSGVDGLGGMADAVDLAGARFLRPFLTVERAALRAVLRLRGNAWCEDGSNEDPRFARVRARLALAALAPLGIDAQGLATTASRMRRARGALEAEVAEALRRSARDEKGTVILSPETLDMQPEIRDRLIVHCLRGLVGASYPPRHAALKRWVEMARAGRAGPLMGCMLRPEPVGLRLFREAAAVRGRQVPAGDVWDGRWRAEAAGSEELTGLVMRALGREGLLALSRAAAKGRHDHWRETGLPQAALEAQPGLWRDGKLVAAPSAGWPAGWRLRVRPVALAGTDIPIPPD